MLRSEPLLGEVGRGLPDSLFDFCRAPQQFALDLAREQGPVAWFRLTQELFAVLSDPNSVYAVLNGNPDDFEKGDLYELVRAVFGESIFTSDGRRWADLHAVIAPLFSRQRIRMLAGPVAALSAGVADGWGELAGESAIDLLQGTKRLAFDVVRTLLGLAGGREADDLFAVLDRGDRMESVRLRYLGKRVPEIRGPFRRSRLNDVVDGAAHAMAEQRLAQSGGTDDLLGAAMASPLYTGLPEPGQRAFVRDFVASMLAAGYVSTGESLFWAFYLLATHPEVQARTREEIAGAGPDAAAAGTGCAALPHGGLLRGPASLSAGMVFGADRAPGCDRGEGRSFRPARVCWRALSWCTGWPVVGRSPRNSGRSGSCRERKSFPSRFSRSAPASVPAWGARWRPWKRRR